MYFYRYYVVFSRFFLEASRDRKGNVVSKVTAYVDAIPNIRNNELERVHNGEWLGTAMEASDDETEAAQETRTSIQLLREPQKRQHSLALGAKSFSSSKAATSSSQSSAPLYTSCADYCAAHVRQCVRLCLGFDIRLRGLCRAHCRARKLECPRECAGRF